MTFAAAGNLQWANETTGNKGRMPEQKRAPVPAIFFWEPHPSTMISGHVWVAHGGLVCMGFLRARELPVVGMLRVAGCWLVSFSSCRVATSYHTKRTKQVGRVRCTVANSIGSWVVDGRAASGCAPDGYFRVPPGRVGPGVEAGGE